MVTGRGEEVGSRLDLLEPRKRPSLRNSSLSKLKFRRLALVMLIFYYSPSFHMEERCVYALATTAFKNHALEMLSEELPAQTSRERLGSDCQSLQPRHAPLFLQASKCQCCCPRPLPQTPAPAPLKDVLCRVRRNLLFLFAGTLSRLPGGKAVLVTEINWTGWLYGQFLFLFML